MTILFCLINLLNFIKIEVKLTCNIILISGVQHDSLIIVCIMK